MSVIAPIVDQVVEFYDDLFRSLFLTRFEGELTERLRRRAVERDVAESADAASQSLARFLLNQGLSEQQVFDLIAGLRQLSEHVELEDLTNPNVPAESLVEKLEQDVPCPEALASGAQAGDEATGRAVYRVALELTVQVLTLVGPVIAEWRKINFSREFELLERVIDRLNAISSSIGVMAASAQDVVDERFELSYRDYLLQRFFRVEAGTVRMTTNVNVDLRELFVMPRVLPRPVLKDGESVEGGGLAELMDLAKAREVFQVSGERVGKDKHKEDQGITALEHVLDNRRTVIVGTPGGGKSTFLEWLQLRIANADEEFILGDQQAIPLLLRVRQLDPENLPRGAALIEKATASKDRAELMPEGWIERQMAAGRVLLMVDGLDETEPELRDRYVLPWLAELCNDYPDCAYVVSSRPAGYPPGTLRRDEPDTPRDLEPHTSWDLEFVECDLCDFDRSQIEEYCAHWCTAVRLSQNEPEKEARREGQADGKQIVAGFEQNPYILDLAKSPLMLSAICLVNYFEGGQLPDDRAKLYQLCVEGLLHHWDQRRGIHSDFSLDEKLRVCRELAIAMQAKNLAEYDETEVQTIFADVLGDAHRADALLQHIRYRTGLLLERRAGVYAFAHLTFQEYLAARAVSEGNALAIDTRRLANEYADGRWKEVIAIYCGLAPAGGCREMIQQLLDKQDESLELLRVLTESLLAAGSRVPKEDQMRSDVLEQIARTTDFEVSTLLDRFPDAEIASIADRWVRRGEHSSKEFCATARWFYRHPEFFDVDHAVTRLCEPPQSKYENLCELLFLVHCLAPDEALADLADQVDLYSARVDFSVFSTVAEIAFLSLVNERPKFFELNEASVVIERVFLKVLNALASQDSFGKIFDYLDLYVRSRLGGVSRLVRERSPYRSEALSLLDEIGRRMPNGKQAWRRLRQQLEEKAGPV